MPTYNEYIQYMTLVGMYRGPERWRLVNIVRSVFRRRNESATMRKHARVCIAALKELRGI